MSDETRDTRRRSGRLVPRASCLVPSLPDWLRYRALTSPRRPALIAGSVRWSFAELDGRATEAARCLAALGVGTGGRVGLLARNGPAFVVVTHALGRLGAVLVPLNTRLTPVELAWQLDDAGVGLILHDAANATAATAVADLIQSPRTIELGPLGPAGATASVRLRKRIALDDVQGIVYTSGTTGQPKGAMLTFGNHWASAVASALHLGHHRDDRWLAMLPLFHVGGLAILFRGVIAGVPVVLHDGFDPARANRAIDEEGVTLVSVVAEMLHRMLAERGDLPYPAALRALMLGGGPAPHPLLEDCLRRGVPVAPTYGLTEAASQVATLLPQEVAEHLGSAGQPLPGTEVRIEHEGREVPPGEVGEIIVRGPTIMRGYLAAAATRNGIRRGGWFATGDLGRFDEVGYLTVLDRRDDLIISGGENVYPAEVEAVLLTHPAVAEAAVVGVPDDRWGQVPIAYLKAKPARSPTELELISYCAPRLAPFKQPRRIEWVEALPRNAAGKLQRARLRPEA